MKAARRETLLHPEHVTPRPYLPRPAFAPMERRPV